MRLIMRDDESGCRVDVELGMAEDVTEDYTNEVMQWLFDGVTKATRYGIKCVWGAAFDCHAHDYGPMHDTVCDIVTGETPFVDVIYLNDTKPNLVLSCGDSVTDCTIE